MTRLVCQAFVFIANQDNPTVGMESVQINVPSGVQVVDLGASGWAVSGQVPENGGPANGYFWIHSQGMKPGDQTCGQKFDLDQVTITSSGYSEGSFSGITLTKPSNGITFTGNTSQGSVNLDVSGYFQILMAATSPITNLQANSLADQNDDMLVWQITFDGPVYPFFYIDWGDGDKGVFTTFFYSHMQYSLSPNGPWSPLSSVPTWSPANSPYPNDVVFYAIDTQSYFVCHIYRSAYAESQSPIFTDPGGSLYLDVDKTEISVAPFSSDGNNPQPQTVEVWPLDYTQVEVAVIEIFGSL